jgi:hypothetical protein
MNCKLKKIIEPQTIFKFDINIEHRFNLENNNSPPQKNISNHVLESSPEPYPAEAWLTCALSINWKGCGAIPMMKQPVSKSSNAPLKNRSVKLCSIAEKKALLLYRRCAKEKAISGTMPAPTGMRICVKPV